MEDLAPLGFRLADRGVMLDLAHCVIVMRRLATFHAASAILYQQDPDCMAPFMESVYTEPVNQKMLIQFFSGMCSCANLFYVSVNIPEFCYVTVLSMVTIHQNLKEISASIFRVEK
jgi:hypothetical protein